MTVRFAVQARRCSVGRCLLMTVLACLAASAADGQTPDVGAAPAGQAAEPWADEPAANAVLASDPDSPEQLLDAVLTLGELGYPQAAEQWLDRLAKLPGDEQARLARRIGSDRLLRQLRVDGLSEKGLGLVRDLLAAAHAAAQDPTRIADRIERLGSTDAFVRHAALVDLMEAGSDGAAACIAALADADRTSLHPYLEQAVVAMGPVALDPLLGALEADDAGFLSRLLSVCGRLGRHFEPWAPFVLAAGTKDPSRGGILRESAQAFVQMTGRRPPTGDAARHALMQASEQWLAAGAVPAVDHQGQATLWHWDAITGKCTARRYGTADARRVLGGRLAAAAARMTPRGISRVGPVLAVLLEAAAIQRPWRTEADQAWQELLRARPPTRLGDLNDTLRAAMSLDLVRAAIAATALLGQTGAEQVLHAGPQQFSPLVDALIHPDRRLRQGAAEAIFQLQPSRPFAGSSRLAPALAYCVATTGRRQALVADSRPAGGTQIAELLQTLDYDTDTAPTGHALMARARGSADVQLIIVRADVQHPPARELIYRLRRDWRTGSIPILLIGSTTTFVAAQRLADADPLTVAAAEPTDADDLKKIVQRLPGGTETVALDGDQRRQQAAWALTRLQQLLAGGLPVDPPGVLQEIDQVESALFSPAPPPAASDVLALAGLPSSQTALVETAGNSTMDPALRRQAVDALEVSVRKFGILLTSDQILQQYDRYNASASSPLSHQQILASILDVLESAHRANP